MAKPEILFASLLFYITTIFAVCHCHRVCINSNELEQIIVDYLQSYMTDILTRLKTANYMVKLKGFHINKGFLREVT